MSADFAAAEGIFPDTNIQVCAFDREAGEKHRSAKEWLKCFWDLSTPPQLSVQVLQEFHVTLVRKGHSIRDSAAVVTDFLAWPAVANSIAIMQHALALQVRYQLSYWDSSILAAAYATGCTRVWPEDLNAGQDYDGVVVENPFERRT